MQRRRRFTYLAAGRRWRKTTLAMMLAAEGAIQGEAMLWGAPTFGQCEIGWREMQRACAGAAHFARNRMEVTFPSGGSVTFRSLDDPDNRRPVDFALRDRLLARLDEGHRPDWDEPEGAAKLLVVSRALRLRRDRPGLFSGYAPVVASGAAADHVVAFDRGGAVTVGTRLPVRLERDGGWRDTTVAVSGTDALTGRSYAGETPVTELLADYPVALLAP